MENNLTQGKIFSKILLFALPIIIGGLLQEVYQLTDTMIVGQTLGSMKLGAVGSTGALVFLATGFINGLASGCAVLTSEAFGAKKPIEVRKSVAAQILICAIASVAMAVGLCFGASPLLLVSRTPTNLYPYALEYLTIIYAGLPATALYWVTATQLRAVGDSKTPLLIMAFTATLNVGLDFLFILGFKWDVRGAAIATVLAQFLAGLLCWWIIRRKTRNLLPKRESWQDNGLMIKNELRLGLPMGAQYAVISVGLIIVQYFVNSFGEAAVAAYTVGARLQIMMESPPTSMGTAIATYVGQNLGAERFDRIKKGVLQSELVSIAYTVVVAILVYTCANGLIGLFLSPQDTEAIRLAKVYLMYMCPMEWSLATLLIYRSALEGLRDGLVPMIGSVLEVAMRIIIPIWLCPIIGYDGACISEPAAWTASAILMFPVFQIRLRKFAKSSKSAPAL